MARSQKASPIGKLFRQEGALLSRDPKANYLTPARCLFLFLNSLKMTTASGACLFALPVLSADQPGLSRSW